MTVVSQESAGKLQMIVVNRWIAGSPQSAIDIFSSSLLYLEQPATATILRGSAMFKWFSFTWRRIMLLSGREQVLQQPQQ